MKTFDPGNKFKLGDEVLVIDYPDKEKIGSTGVITGWDGRYWNVDIHTDELDNKYLFETGELEIINPYYKYNPDQAGDTEDDV